MFPLRDNIPSRTTPFVNYSIIAVCGVVYLLQLSTPSLIERYGMVPARLSHPGATLKIERQELVKTPFGPLARRVEKALPPAAVPEWLTPLTCIFLHGGWLHILGNLWFLHIFGDNVEDRFGHATYAAFYLVCGVGASAAHFWSAPESAAPTIGASGAIAGVMGAYLLLYPRALVLALIPIFIIIEMIVVPAPLFLGVWFLLQFMQGAMTSSGAGGVAWWAHIGGFVLGVVGTLLLAPIVKPPVDRRRSNAERIGHYRVRF